MRAIIPGITRALGGLLVLSTALAGSTPAAAWTAETHEALAQQAGRLMPTSLQRVLAENRARLLQGATAPLASRGLASQYLHAGGSYGTLDDAIFRQVQRILDLLSARASLSAVAYEFGVLSHLVALTANPTHAAADDPEEAAWARQFEQFTESRRARFRIVFDGYLSTRLSNDDVRGFARDACDRSRRHYAILAQSYRDQNGRVTRGARFDDRHPVFGVASLSYAHAIGDTAKLWLYVWIQAGGDTAGLAFPLGRESSRPRILRQGAGQ